MTKPSYEELRITKHSGSPQIADSASGDNSSSTAKEIRAGLHDKDPRKKMEFWCAECKRRHAPTEEHPLCPHDGMFLHAPPPKDIYFIHRGWKFTPPFICMGCGIEVCFRQWAFSRSCGPCDVSSSRTRRLLYGKCFVGPHELIDAKSDAFIPEDHFVDPKDREEYPVIKMPEMRVPRPAKPFRPRRTVTPVRQPRRPGIH